jgi:hypothetical protein
MYTGKWPKHPYFLEVDFDVDNVHTLNNFITVLAEDHDIKTDIVVSSDWRLNYDLPLLQKFYQRQGIISIPVGITPRIPIDVVQYNSIAKMRAEEILAYIRIHSIKDNWIAIDDLNMTEFLPKNHFIHCRYPKPSLPTPATINTNNNTNEYGLCREIDILHKMMPMIVQSARSVN